MIALDDNVSTLAFKNVVSNIFKHRFQGSLCPYIFYLLAIFPYLKNNDILAMEASFNEEEALQALKKANGDKLQVWMAFLSNLLNFSTTFSKDICLVCFIISMRMPNLIIGSLSLLFISFLR